MLTNLPFQKDYEAYRAAWEALNPQIDHNIELHRKTNLEIEVVNSNGVPVPDAHVEVKQLDHDFIFGCNGLMLGGLGEKEEAYRESFGKLFNLVTTTLCWLDTEYEPGKFRFADGIKEIFRRPPIDRVFEFASQYHLKVKGQPLFCEHWCPDWSSKEPRKLKEQIAEYFPSVASHCGDRLDIVDVVNEAFLATERTPDFPLLDETFSMIDWAFEAAGRVFFQATRLELNEASYVNCERYEEYYQIARRLMDQNLPIRLLGIQYHLFNAQQGMMHLRDEKMGLSDMLRAYQRLNQLGLPLFISEVTIPSTFEGTRQQGEALQAEIARNLYRLWFSTENMAGVIYWNLKDGQAWGTEGNCLGCLLDQECREKPSYQALYQLIRREWMTNETTTCDENGKSVLRGFKGNYAVTAEKDGRTVRGKLHAGHDTKLRLVL